MQRINKGSAKSTRSAVILPLESRLSSLFDARAIAISKMSGYPVPRHALARLQKLLKLDSLKSLLESIAKVSELTTLTAEVIESMDATNLNKYQLNRTDVVAYVSNVTVGARNISLTDDEIDIIAHVITTSEANPDAWVLASAAGDDNLHLSFYNLYQEILKTDNPGALPIFSPSAGNVVAFNSLPMYKKKGAKNNIDEKSALVATDAIIYQFSATRIVDHIYQLLMDKSIWPHFLAPRKIADVASNLDRAKSLRVFSLYLQSLLTYHQFFAMEAYLHTYDVLQNWLISFPALETETMNKIEASIRKHDFLGAREDAQGLLSSFGLLAKNELGSFVFPSEYLGSFGFKAKVEEITAAVNSVPVPSVITEIATLDDPKFVPLLAGGIASKFDVAYQLADLLIREKVVESVVNEALKGLIPFITRGTSKMALSALEALNIKCTIPFVIPAATTHEIIKGAERRIQQGTFYNDSAAAPYCYDYHKILREDYRFRMLFSRTMIEEANKFKANYVVDFDRATLLRKQLNYEWKSFTPSYLAGGSHSFNAKTWGVSEDSVRELVEYVTGESYEIIIRQLSVADMRSIWATFTSAFCITYHKPGDNRELHDVFTAYDPAVDNASLTPVTGYGKPFGTTYASLADLQGALTDKERLIPLGWGLYIRVIKIFPTPTAKLAFDKDSWHNQYPFGYFQANSGRSTVTTWVKEEGLWNHALTPVTTRDVVPSVKFTPAHAYANADLYLNVYYFYSPDSPAEAREKMPIPLVTEEWSLERYGYWLQYIHWGRYGSPAAGDTNRGDTEQLADVIKQVESQILKNDAAAAASNKDAGNAMKEVAAKAKDETVGAMAAMKDADLTGDSETPSI